MITEFFVELTSSDFFVKAMKFLNFLPEKFTVSGSDDGVEKGYFVEISIEGNPIDVRTMFKSLTVTKLARSVYTFQMELFDPTFLYEQLFLTSNAKIDIRYGNHLGQQSYKGVVRRVGATVQLSSGVSLTIEGGLQSGDSSLVTNKPRSYPASTFKGSVFNIMKDLCDQESLELIIRDDVKDFAIKNNEGNEASINSTTEEKTTDFIDRLVGFLGPSVSWQLLPPGALGNKKDALMVCTNNSSMVEGSTSKTRVVVDLNSRNSKVSSYNFSIEQSQFDQVGRAEKIVSYHSLDNSLITSQNNVSAESNPNLLKMFNGLTKDVYDTTNWLVSGSDTQEEIGVEGRVRTAQKLESMYRLDVDIVDGVPNALPILTELEVWSWITSPTNQTKNFQHHTTGLYTVVEVKDVVGNGLITTSLSAFKVPSGPTVSSTTYASLSDRQTVVNNDDQTVANNSDNPNEKLVLSGKYVNSKNLILSERGLNFIKKSEGLSLKAYWDYTAYSIGYGTQRGGTVQKDERCTEAQATQWLLDDLQTRIKVVQDLNVPMTQNMFDVLVSFIFNVGVGGLSPTKSSVYKAIKSKDYLGCANALLLYINAGGKEHPGLIARRKSEKNLFMEDC